MTLTSVIKEASTDMPELTAAANASSEALTKLNDSSNNILTSFSQLSELRRSGRTGEAATVEAKLINEIQKTLADNPALASQALAAVKSGDITNLEKALKENTSAIIAKSIQDQKQVALGSFRETLGGIRSTNFRRGESRFGFGDDLKKQFQEAFKKDVLGVSKLGTGEVSGANLQNLDKQINQIYGNAQADPEVLSDLFSQIGINFKDVGLEGSSEIRLAFNELRTEINRRAEVERNAAADSEESNERLRNINIALKKAYTHYQTLAKNAALNAKLEIDLKNLRRELSVEFNKTVLEGRSAVAETLGVSSAGQRSISNQSRTIEIEESYNKSIQDSVGQVGGLIANLQSELIQFDISKIKQGTEIQAGTQLQKAEIRAGLVQGLSPQFQDFGDRVQNALSTLLSPDGNFDFQSFEATLRSGITTDDENVQKLLTEVISQARETVDLAKKAELTRRAQLAQLAQQNVNQLAQEFAKATVGAFGGFADEFLKKDRGDKSFANEIGDVGLQRQRFVDALNRGQQPITPEETQELGRLSGNLYSALESIVGRPLGLEIGESALREQEVAGRASQIASQFQQIRTEVGKDPAASRVIQEVEKKLAEQVGLIDEYNAIVKPNKTFEEQANQEAAGGERAQLDALFKEVANRTARVQSDELRKTGELDQMFFNTALKSLDPLQQEALKGAGATGRELVKDFLPTQLQQQQIDKTDETNSILQSIRDALLTPNTNALNGGFNFGEGPGQNPLPTFNTTVSPTVNVNLNGGAGTQVNAEGMSAETAKVLEENKDRILAAGGLIEKVANLENTVYNQFPNERPAPRPTQRELRGG